MLLLHLKTLTERFYDNYVITNIDKCSYICLGKNNNDDGTLSFNGFNLKYSDKETILVIKVTENFKKHIRALYSKAFQKSCISKITKNI